MTDIFFTELHQAFAEVFTVSVCWLIVSVLAFMVMDILTGLVYAFSSKTFSSKKMRLGIAHKLVEGLGMVFAVMIDVAKNKAGLSITIGNADIKAPTLIIGLVCGYLIFMEIMSCIENFDKTYPGVLPDKLVSALQQGAKSAGVNTEKTSET